MGYRQALLLAVVAASLVGLLTIGAVPEAWGLAVESGVVESHAETQKQADPISEPGEPSRTSQATGTLRRHRLFRRVDSPTGTTILDVDNQTLPQLAGRRGRFIVEAFPLQGDRTVDLELQPFRVIGAHTRFVLGRRDGPDIPLTFDANKIVLLTGAVVDHPGSNVFLALSETLSTGIIDLGPGRARYGLSSRLGRHRPAMPGRVALFPATASSVGLDGPLCGTGLLGDQTLASLEQDQANSSEDPRSAVLLPSQMRTIELAIETDYEYFELFGDVDAAATYATALVGAVSQVYMRDTHHRFDLTFVRIWDTPADLYNQPDGVDAFLAFADHWQANMGAVQRDAAQYLSGRRDLPFGGIAYLQGICNSFGYSMCGYILGFFPDPDTPSVYHYDIEVSAHELGHNCASPHTDAYNPPIDQCFPTPGDYQRGTIMSYCSQAVSGGNAVHEMRFHSRAQSLMIDYLSQLSCVIDDCNMNDVADATDIAALTSADVNGNGVPDECEDCDSNGTLDSVDIAGGAADLNGNGVPDRCEPDCNTNGVPDDRDILLSTSTDAYGNNVPDECEADCNANATSDFTEIQADLTLDINRNTLLDACEDCDSDGTTDAEALNGAHNAWIASDVLDVIGEYHGQTGVLVKNAEIRYLSDPQDVVITATGRILVSSALDDRVVEFDRTGAYVGDLVGAGSGGLAYPTGLLLMPGGNLLVSSRDTNSVLEYDVANGVYVGDFVGPGVGGLVSPFGLALGPAGTVFVSSGGNQVLEFDGQTGVFLREFVSWPGNGGLLGARGMAFKRDGNLLVAGFSSDAVLEYDGLTGAFLRVFHNGGTVYGPWGVRVGPNGNVFLTRDYEIAARSHDDLDGAEPLHATTTRIYEYDPASGNHLRSYVLGDDTGLSSPTGFAFMPGSTQDCNVNFVPDACDIASGYSLDINADGRPDECGACCRAGACVQLEQTACEATDWGEYLGDQTTCGQGCQNCLIGDWDCNGNVNLVDYASLPDCMYGPERSPNPIPPTTSQDCLGAFDFDEDGDVDLYDVGRVGF